MYADVFCVRNDRRLCARQEAVDDINETRRVFCFVCGSKRVLSGAAGLTSCGTEKEKGQQMHNGIIKNREGH